MKRILSMILSLIMLVAVIPAQSITVYAENVENLTAELFNIYIPAEEFRFNPYYYRIDEFIGNSTVVRIPPEINGVPVKEITGKAFYRNENVTKIVVPEGVEVIGTQAFFGCTNLKSLELPDSLTYIDYDIISLTEMFDNPDNWDDHCFYIGPYLLGIDTFNICGEIHETPVEEIRVKPGTRIMAANDIIGNKYTWAAKRLVLPKSIEYIGRDIINQGTGHAPDDPNWINGPQNQKIHTYLGYIGKYLVGEPNGLDESEIPINVEIKPGTEVIPECFFSEIDYIRSVVTPESLKRIPYACFAGNGVIEKVRLPYVEKIGDGAFSGCQSLHTVQLSEDLTELGAAFATCYALEFIEIFGKVKTIKEATFSSCKSLNNIVIHKGIEKIEHHAFYNCESLTDIYYTGSEQDWKNIDIAPLAFEDANNNEEITIHYNHVPVKRSYEDPIYIPETINEVTITGKGTAYGRYRVYDLWGNPAKNMVVEYTIDGLGKDKTLSDELGFVLVDIKGITEDNEYNITFGGLGITESNGVLKVNVEPLKFTSEFEATFTEGVNVGIGIGVGGSIGNLEAEATLAEIGASGSMSRGISLTQEYEGGKNKVTVSSKQNLEGALDASAGLFAGVETDLGVNVKASAGDVSVGGKVGSVAGVSFEVDDFSLDDEDDVEGVTKFVLCAILDTMGSNAVAREIIKKLGFEINAYEAGNTASLNAGANIGVIGIEGDYADAGITLGGINASSVWSNSSKTSADGTVKYSSSLKAGTDGKIFKFGLKTKGKGKLSGGSAFVAPENLSNNVKLSATRDESSALVDISLTGTDADSKKILWDKSSQEKNFTISYPSESVENITHQDWNLYSFSRGNKAFFTVDEWENAVKTMLDSGEKAKYHTSKAVKQGFDLEISASVKLLAEIGGSKGVSGITSYEYDVENGIYENGEIFVQSVNTIEEQVKDNLITFDDLMDMAEEKMKEELSKLFDIVKDKVDGVIDAGKAKLEYIGDGISAAIKKTKEDMAPAAVLAGTLMDDGETEILRFITVSTPCIVIAEDNEGNEISDFSSSPMLLTLFYTDEELSTSGVNDTDGIKLLMWNGELGAYSVVEAEHDDVSGCFSALITKPGQYVLGYDAFPPVITDFEYNYNNINPEITGIITDESGIGGMSLVINGEEEITVDNICEYYDASSGRFLYPVSHLEDGGYSFELTVTDVFGNTEHGWAYCELYRNTAHISDLTLPEELFPGSKITAFVEDDYGIYNAFLNAEYTDENGDKKLYYAKMYEVYDSERDENCYCAELPGIPAETEFDAWISVFSYYGKKTEGERTTLRMSPVSIVIDEVLSGCVSVVCSNPYQLSDATLYAAAYDADGRFLKAQTADVSENVFFTDLPDGALVRAFLWKDMKPVCESAVYTVEEE